MCLFVGSSKAMARTNLLDFSPLFIGDIPCSRDIRTVYSVYSTQISCSISKEQRSTFFFLATVIALVSLSSRVGASA